MQCTLTFTPDGGKIGRYPSGRVELDRQIVSRSSDAVEIKLAGYVLKMDVTQDGGVNLWIETEDFEDVQLVVEHSGTGVTLRARTDYDELATQLAELESELWQEQFLQWEQSR